MKLGFSKESREFLRSLFKCLVDVVRFINWEFRRYLFKYNYRKFMNIKFIVSVFDLEFLKEFFFMFKNVDKFFGLKKRFELNETKLN